MNIYRSFEQWKNGGFLEHGAPRTEEYTAEELHLVEMGWNYGYDAGRAVEQALDKKAENARELGLSYDDEPKIGCVNHDCDKCKAVQEPVAHSVIAGALFDFMGWLTSRKETLILSSADNASPAVEAITEFAKMRGLSLDGARVQDWQDLTLSTPQPVPVKTYHDGKPWPVQPKPWVGLTDDDIHEQGWNLSADRDYEAWTGREFLVVNGVNDFARAIEAKLKDKNHG